MHVRPIRDQARRGATVIEATLILMMLLMITFGCVDFGFALFEHQTLVNRVCTAARYGAIHTSDFTAIKNMVLYSSPSIPAGKSEGDPGVFGLQASMINVSRFNEGDPEDRIVVTLSGYHFVFVGPYVAGRYTGKAISVSLPVEQQ